MKNLRIHILIISIALGNACNFVCYGNAIRFNGIPVVSKLGDLDSYGQDPRRIAYAGSEVDGASIDFAGKYAQSQQTIKDRYADFEVPYNGKDNDDYVNGQGFCCDDAPLRAAQANDNPELFQYYYHSYHLGSTSLITNLDGEVVQHVEYVPFGEVFIEERNNKWNTPYLFNAKELDEETGLYYYGARYYDPRGSIWLSTDPKQENYPNVSTFAYCHNNPVRLIDPDGRSDVDKVWGYIIGTVTNIIPGSSALRDLYEYDDAADYNNALRTSDNAAMVAGTGMVVSGGGGAGVGAGTTIVVAGGVTSATVVGAPEGAAIALTGAVVVTGSEALMAAGTITMANATSNKYQGYNRWKQSQSSSSSNGNNKPTRNERIQQKKEKQNSTTNKNKSTETSTETGGKEHTKDARPSTKNKHEKGQERKRQGNRGEKGDAKRPYRR